MAGLSVSSNRVNIQFLGLLIALLAPQDPASREPVASFGTTVISSSGFKGDIYFIDPRSKKLPRFDKLPPVGSIYTNVLQIPTRDFREGFPGVTDRFEWFAIDYNGRLWIQESGEYKFSLLSDDGSKLYIDGRTIINNDGVHPAVERAGSVKLKTGLHRIRVSYFQGPAFHVALILNIAAPGEESIPLNLDKFLPPPGHEDWK